MRRPQDLPAAEQRQIRQSKRRPWTTSAAYNRNPNDICCVQLQLSLLRTTVTEILVEFDAYE